MVVEMFQFLIDAARKAGADAAVIIPAEQIVVEERVRLKCQSGCASYGKYLTCPPHTPTPAEFRACLLEYRQALMVKFTSPALLDETIRFSYLRARFDPDASPSQKESVQRFLKDFSPSNRHLNEIMLELERTAFNAGYPFALTTSCGTCGLCETCNTKTCSCNHPTQRRFPPEALGINVVKTTWNAGVPISFPAPPHPERVAILLID